MVPYKSLENHFTSPKIISPFYGDKIPRKLKKKVKFVCGIHWSGLNNGQRLWYYLGTTNPNYKSYIIKLICKTMELTNKQFDVAENWLSNHFDHVKSLIQDADFSYKPSQEDINHPMLWKPAHWRWFNEQYNLIEF